MRRTTALLAAIAAAAVTAAAPAVASPATPTPPTAASAAAAPGPGYITIQFGRSTWRATQGPDCTTPDNTRTLEDAARALHARGLTASGGVVLANTNESTRKCLGYVTSPSWRDLARLRDQYRWTFHSQGARYADMTLMTTDEQRRRESVETLPVFLDHGHTDAWGAFFYPKNNYDAAAERVVTEAFAFGRVYGPGPVTRGKATTYPYPMPTLSVNGGRCHNPALPCARLDVKNNRVTTTPVQIGARLSPGPDEWGVVQFYRFVSGRHGSITGDDFAWDCTSGDWRNRWTRQPELYCWNTFLGAIDRRSRSVLNVDAAYVAAAWGRIPR